MFKKPLFFNVFVYAQCCVSFSDLTYDLGFDFCGIIACIYILGGRRRPKKNATFVRQEVFPSKVLKTEPTFEPNLDEDTKGVKSKCFWWQLQLFLSCFELICMILYMYVCTGRGRGRGRPRKKALSPEQREPSVETFEETPCLEEINLFSPTTITKSKLSHLTCIFLTIESPSLILFVFPGGRGRPRKTTQSLHQEKTLHDNRKHHCQNEFSKETDDEKELSGKYVQQHAVQMSKFWFFFSLFFPCSA